MNTQQTQIHTELTKYVADNVHVQPGTGSSYYTPMSDNHRRYLSEIYDTWEERRVPTLEQIAKCKLLDVLPTFEKKPFYTKIIGGVGNFAQCDVKTDNFRPFARDFLPDLTYHPKYMQNFMAEVVPLCGRTFVIIPRPWDDHGYKDDDEITFYGLATNSIEKVEHPYLYEIGWVEIPSDHIMGRWKPKRLTESGTSRFIGNYCYLPSTLYRALIHLSNHHYTGFTYFYCNVAIFRQLKTILRILGKQKQYRNLLLSGDVETNPGPVFSKLRTNMRNNNPSILAKRMKAQVFGLEKTSDNLEQISKLLSTALPSFMSFIENQQYGFHTEIHNDIAKVNEIVTKACDVHKDVSGDIVKAVLISAICLALCCMKHHKTSLTLALISLFKLYRIPEHVIKMCELELSRHRAQVISSDLTSIGKVLLTGLSCLFLNKIPDEKNFLSLTKKLSGMGHALKGVKEMFSSIDGIWTVIRDQLEDMIWADSPVSFKTLKRRITDWSAKITKYSECNEMDKLVGDMDASNDVQRLYQEGLQLKQEVFSIRDKDLALHVQQFTTHAKSLYEYLSKTNVRGAGFRVVPYPIVIYGESGVGKSALSILLACDLLMALGHKPESAFHHMYARQSETEFWDGYHNHDVIIYDDAFQRNDDASNPNVEVMELIRSVNVFPQHLHMACLEDKNTYLTAKSIIYSMNNINVQLKSIAHPDAFHRRLMENAWKVVPAPGYEKQVEESSGLKRTLLDSDKILNKDVLDDKIYNLIRMERTQAGEYVPVGEPIPYTQFIDLQIRGMRENFSKWTNVGKSLYDRMAEQHRQKAQVGGRSIYQELNQPSPVHVELPVRRGKDLFFDARPTFDDDTTFFGDIIAKGLVRGESMEFIEESILLSMHSERYMNWKAQIPPESFCEKWRRRAKEIAEALKTSVEKFWSSCMDWFNRQKLKYPRLFQFLKIAGVVTGLVAAYHAFVGIYTKCVMDCDWDKMLDHDLSDSEIEDIAAKLCYLLDKKKMTEDEASDIWTRVEWNIVGDYDPNADNSYMIETKIGILRKELASSGDKNTQRISRMKIELASSGSHPKTTNSRMRTEFSIRNRYCSEAVRDVNAYEMMIQAAKTSQYRLQVSYGNSTYDIGNVIALSGYNFVMPFHYLTYLRLRKAPLDTICHLNGCLNGKNVTNRVIEFPLSEIVGAWNEVDQEIGLNRAVHLKQHRSQNMVDGVVFTISDRSKCHAHRDIVKHFITQDEVSRLKGKMLGMLSTYTADGETCTLMTKELVDVQMIEKELEIDVDVDGKTEVFRECGGFQYNAHTVPGDCGGILVVRALSLPHKFLGYHISGALEGGFSIKLTKEMIDAAFRELETKIGYHAQVKFYAPDAALSSETPKGAFVSLGKSEIPLSQATRTALEKSPLHGKLRDTITAPARLTPFRLDDKIIDPLVLGLEKCGGNPPLLDSCDLNQVGNAVKQVYHTKFNTLCDYDALCRVIPYEESIRGNDDAYICSINRTTSPGYPFNSDPKFRNSKAGKQHWMGKDENFDFTSQPALELRTLVTDLIEDCYGGVIRNVICADTLKDERRPIAKVKAGKTRVFSACPMHYVVAFRQYFIGFASWVMHNRISNESSVGINPYLEWGHVYQKVSKKGNAIIAGDFSNFDGSLNVQILWMIFDIVDSWYAKKESSEEYCRNTRIRRGLWIHLVNSVHIYRDNFVMWTHSQPSGNPFTVILNTVYNSIIVRLAYLKICDLADKPADRSMIAFNRYISMLAYGDDNLINISATCIDWVHQHSFSEAMLKLGHIYTEETKGENTTKYRSISEVAFLKRSFRKNDSLGWDAALDKSVIYEMVSWIRKGYVDAYSAMGQTLECALREMTLHGKNSFDLFVSELVENGVLDFMTIYTYEEYRLGLMYSDWASNSKRIGIEDEITGSI